MILKVNRTSFRTFLKGGGGGGVVEFLVLMNHDPVVLDSGLRIGGFLALGVVGGGGIIDVIGLPDEGREGHVDLGRGDGVEPAAFIVLALQAKAVQHLAFVAALQVAATVAPALAACGGHVGDFKFRVERETSEFRLAGDALHERVSIQFPILKSIR